jgi:hypothetical protein
MDAGGNAVDPRDAVCDASGVAITNIMATAEDHLMLLFFSVPVRGGGTQVESMSKAHRCVWFWIDPFLGALGPFKLLWVSVGQYFIFGALCPSKSGLMNKHIVKPGPFVLPVLSL